MAWVDFNGSPTELANGDGVCGSCLGADAAPLHLSIHDLHPVALHATIRSMEANFSQQPAEVPHPGGFIKEHVIPDRLSVTAAAKQLGVSRPTLSKLLNGKSSLSPSMAMRLEKAFGADHQELLKFQERFDRHARQKDENAIVAHSYVPEFLTAIKARQIHVWPENNINARHRLPVLLRKLIRSTGDGLRLVDFPGYDNAEQKGWDGLVEAEAATPWIPQGRSGWELSTAKDSKRKADHDYVARLRTVPLSERCELTFVFVTSRIWKTKRDWVDTTRKRGDWKQVQAYDANDLEQWIEESIPAPIWLAEELKLPVTGVRTLENFWQHWASASTPEMDPSIFDSAVKRYRSTFTNWLEKIPQKPLVLAADSCGEALAFLACVFRDPSTLAVSKESALVFESPETLQKIAASNSSLIPIVYSLETERELAPVAKQRHSIAVKPRNSANLRPDISLDVLDQETFEKALVAMGIDRDKIPQLSRESGRSPTILRRRLSQIPAIRTPQWAEDVETARNLIPMVLIGAWHAGSRADQEILRALAERSSYREIEEAITKILIYEDCPLWAVGQDLGIVSRIDAIFAISPYVTKSDIDEFILLAEYVLSEEDPALDLPENERLFAELYQKTREHSSAIRAGINESLVVLSVYGNDLFQERLGIDMEGLVSSLINRLLSPLTPSRLQSNNDDLPFYAEAAPDAFMRLLEKDLERDQPAVYELLKPAKSDLFNECPRTGLLWALECLAWGNLGRVSAILARMARIKINDNWTNKPINTLKSIYRSWMPQTSAPLEERIAVLEMLTDRFPDIAWQLCIQQIGTHDSFGEYCYRPRWRSDALGSGEPVSQNERYIFARKALDLVLGWPTHEAATLRDLIERVDEVEENDQLKIWKLVNSWADTTPDPHARAGVAESIRRFAFTRPMQQNRLSVTGLKEARRTYSKLREVDPIARHIWLFESRWIKFSRDVRAEFLSNSLDNGDRTEEIHDTRLAAITEIREMYGIEGVFRLVESGVVADLVGEYLARGVAETSKKLEVLEQCLALGSKSATSSSNRDKALDLCILGFLHALDEDTRTSLMSAFADSSDRDVIARLFRCAPFGKQTWKLLARHTEQTQDRYWREVRPAFSLRDAADLTEAVDRLLNVRRPHVAFQIAKFCLNLLETSRLKRILMELPKASINLSDDVPVDAYEIASAFEALDKRPGIDLEERANLEFWYIRLLENSSHGIPNLEKYVARSPAFFFKLVSFACVRRDHKQDPPELRIDDPKKEEALASAALSILDRIKHIPGTDSDGKINAKALLSWINEARTLCAKHDRKELGDQYIGGLLSRANSDEGGIWPCVPICEVMESLLSDHIGVGFQIGVINKRGAHVHAPGGQEEREIAMRYRRCAEEISSRFPYVSRIIEDIAKRYEQQAKSWDLDAKLEQRRIR